MGCDIHWVLEQKTTKGWVGVAASGVPYARQRLPRWADPDQWRDWPYPIIKERDYEFFAALAGVRGDGPDPKGLPDDASDLVELNYEDGDCHSASWETVEAFCTIKARVESEEAVPQMMRDKLEGKGINYVEKYFGYLDTTLNYRVVFWFDN